MSKNRPFEIKVYGLVKEIPKGRVSTYKYIAQALKTKAYRAVGQALKRNPYAPIVPCHRVISSNGTIGGFNGKTQGIEIAQKRKILEKEGILFSNGKVINFEKRLYRFT